MHAACIKGSWKLSLKLIISLNTYVEGQFVDIIEEIKHSNVARKRTKQGTSKNIMHRNF